MLGDNGDNDLNSCFRVDYESGKYALRKEGFNWVLLIGREKQNPQKKKKNPEFQWKKRYLTWC